jgi:hypothetical protein
MAEEEKKIEGKKPETAAAPAGKKMKLNLEELAARISLYIAFAVLVLGVLVKLELINILGIAASNYLHMTTVWLLISIAIVLWNINKKIMPKT